MKKIICMFLICISLCGCQSYSEIEDVMLVGGIAVDKGEDENYKVSVEIVGMSEGGEEGPLQSKVISSEGKTVFSALSDINSATSKELYLSQATVIAISEPVAREGLIDIIDVIVRDEELRITNDVIVTKDCAAAELFTLESAGEPIRSYEIQGLLENEKETVSVTPRVRVYELIDIIGSSGVSAILPAFSKEQSEEKANISVFGTAVFRGDKLDRFLDEKESKIMMLILGQTRRGVISEPIKTDTEEYMTVEIFDCRTKVTHKQQNGEITMYIDINMDVGINELTTKEDIMTMEGRQTLVEKIEKRVERDTEEFVRKMQTESGSDVFGFGERIYKQNPKLWRKIKDTDYFSSLKVKTKAKVTLRSTGFINKSPSRKDFRLSQEKGGEK